MRASNISKIKRKAGLPELGEIAQLAVVELEHREDDIIELEAIVEDDEKEIANLKDEIARLKSEIAAHVAAEASEASDPDVESSGAEPYDPKPPRWDIRASDVGWKTAADAVATAASP